MDNPKLTRILIGALCVLYLVLRLWRLTDACLWFDEIFSIPAAEHSWNTIFWFVAQDLIHPPLFYGLLKLWIRIGGESVLWLRLFSVVLSAAALLPFLGLCRELKLKLSTTLLALAFLAVNGSLIKYAQEVRMYGLLLCLSVFSLWLFARFFYRGKNIWILTAVNVLLVYTHYFGWLILFGEVLVIAIIQRIKIRHVLIMLAIDLAAFAPWMIAVAKAVRAGSAVSQNIGWIERPGVRSIFELAFDLIEPFYYQTNSIEPSTIVYVTLPLLAVITSAMLVHFIEWKRRENPDVFWILGIMSLFPVATGLLISWLAPFSIWGSRHLLIIFVPVLILAAVFLTEISNRTIRYVLVIGAVLLSGIGFYHEVRVEKPEQVWCAWERIVREVPDDKPQTIYAFEDLSAYHLWFATRNSPNIKVVKVDGVPGMVEDRAYFLPRGFDGIPRTEANGMNGERFWLAFRDVKFNEKHPPAAGVITSGYRIENKFELGPPGGKAFMVEAVK